jgi:hypothetical protein
MTIAVLFFAKEKLGARLNMCLSSLGDKPFDELTDEELERNGFPFYDDVKIVTNRRKGLVCMRQTRIHFYRL